MVNNQRLFNDDFSAILPLYVVFGKGLVPARPFDEAAESGPVDLVESILWKEQNSIWEFRVQSITPLSPFLTFFTKRPNPDRSISSKFWGFRVRMDE